MASQTREDVLAWEGVFEVVVLADVRLHLGDKVVLVLGVDDGIAERDFVYLRVRVGVLVVRVSVTAVMPALQLPARSGDRRRQRI